jgi:hypothetical protein
LISNLGVIGWCAAAAMCLFCAGVLRKRDDPSERRNFLAASGCLMGLLLFDDLFLLHEIFFP